LGGDQFSFTVPGQIVSRTGFASAFTQMFGSTYPGYGFTVSLTLPVRNHLAEANLADARSSKEHDLYAQRQVQQAITIDVANAVHQLEESKLSMAAAKIALNLSQKTLDAEQHKYELGAETVFFVLEAQTELTGSAASAVAVASELPTCSCLRRARDGRPFEPLPSANHRLGQITLYGPCKAGNRSA